MSFRRGRGFQNAALLVLLLPRTAIHGFAPNNNKNNKKGSLTQQGFQQHYGSSTTLSISAASITRQGNNNNNNRVVHKTRNKSRLRLEMTSLAIMGDNNNNDHFQDASSPSTTRQKKTNTQLSATADFSAFSKDAGTRVRLDWKGIISVLSCALLITGNTVGAGALVLPQLTARTGLSVASVILFGIYFINVISGCLIAEVAIHQYESSSSSSSSLGNNAPSSFKSLADSSLNSHLVGNAVSGTSLMANIAVLTFALARGGSTMSTMLTKGAVSARTMSLALASLLATACASCSSKHLSHVASVVVVVLFGSFGCLLVPGMANVPNPIATLFAPGTGAADLANTIAYTAPIFLDAMVYQNIVPSVTRILSYNRIKTATALALGQLMPTLLYLSYCFAVNGGGITPNSGGLFLAIFSLSAIWGSAMGCVLSIGEEIQSLLFKKATAKRRSTQPLYVPAVLTAVVVPLGITAMNVGGDFTGALRLAGGYFCPMLYGFLPAIMALIQRRKQKKSPSNSLVPGGNIALGFMSLASLFFVGEHLMIDLGFVRRH